jgi:FkbM family methyltransferase
MTATPFRFHLETLIELLLAATPQPFALQIGAMDGVRFDPIHSWLSRGGWKALLVEPLPDLFAALVRNYRDVPGLAFANVAIADHVGTLTLNRVDPEAIRSGAAPEWSVGASSVFDDRNSMGGVKISEADWARIRPHVRKETVACTTLAALLATECVERIDLLQIDTEGYDYQVLRQLDFGRFRPAIVHLEHYLLPPAEQACCAVPRNGYVLARAISTCCDDAFEYRPGRSEQRQRLLVT